MEHPFSIVSLMPAWVQATYTQVVMLFVSMIIITILGLFVVRMKKEIPNRSQSFAELTVNFVYGISDDIMGRAGRPYVPLIFGIGMYVTISNLLGIVPGLLAPTANMNTTAAPAICVFIFYNYIGLKRHGLGYIKHFMGPMLVLAPFIFIIELIGHIARPLSLTMRLFGNIAGEDLVLAILFVLVPFIVPVPMLFIIVFTSLLQAYVFMMLSMVYISGALAEAH